MTIATNILIKKQENITTLYCTLSKTVDLLLSIHAEHNYSLRLPKALEKRVKFRRSFRRSAHWNSSGGLRDGGRDRF